MPRSLVLVPLGRDALGGATAIGRDYPRTHSGDDMRRWADGLDRLYRDAERGLAIPDRGATADAQRHFIADPSLGIRGSLRPDGKVELDAGRHRAHYLVERGVDPVPVWVSSRDAGALAAFRADCHAEVARSRPALLAAARERDGRNEPPPDREPIRAERER